MNFSEKTYCEKIYKLTDKCRNVIKNLGVTDLTKLETTNILKTIGYRYNIPGSEYTEIDGFAHTYKFTYKNEPYLAEFLFRNQTQDRRGEWLTNFLYNCKVRMRTEELRKSVKKVIVLGADEYLTYPIFVDYDKLPFKTLRYGYNEISNTYYFKIDQNTFDNVYEDYKFQKFMDDLI